MKLKSISFPVKFITCAVVAVSMLAGSLAQTSGDKVELSLLGNLVKNNAKGDYKFPGGFAFKRSGSRAYINFFAKKMAANDTEVKDYEDVIMQGIRVWEEQYGPKGYTNDLAGGLAFFTVVNHGLAKNEAYKDGMIGNLVAQNRKAFCSKLIATMTPAKKQELYDYMITEAVYMQAIASAGQERNQNDVADMISKFSSAQIKSAFGVDASMMEITENGVVFK
jgi:hypothetical protein